MLSALGFLIGTWTCSFGTAVFSYDLQNNYIRQTDTFSGGGGDVAYLTYVPKGSYWNWTVIEPQGSTTIFRGSGPATQITFRTVYPAGDDGVEVFNRISDTKYSTTFNGTLEGKKYNATDTCTKP